MGPFLNFYLFTMISLVREVDVPILLLEVKSCGVTILALSEGSAQAWLTSIFQGHLEFRNGC